LLEESGLGLAKVIVDKSGKVIGAHILGNSADEIIHELHLLRLLGKPLHSVHSVSHAYPTYAEAIIKRIADIAYVDRMNNFWTRLVLRWLPGYNNRLSTIKDIL
jgi:hypothetical protein